MKKLLIIMFFTAQALANATGSSPFQPFDQLNQLAQRIENNKLVFSPIMAEKDLSFGYKKLALKYHPDKGGTTSDFQTLEAAYNQAKKLLNPSPEMKFILDEGTYVIGTIPLTTSPLHFGLLTTTNDDPQKGELVCFGPQHYIKDGKRSKVRGGKASDDCFRAHADESDFGCRELRASKLYEEKSSLCKESCWRGGTPSLLKSKPEPANCDITSLYK